MLKDEWLLSTTASDDGTKWCRDRPVVENSSTTFRPPLSCPPHSAETYGERMFIPPALRGLGSEWATNGSSTCTQENISYDNKNKLSSEDEAGGSAEPPALFGNVQTASPIGRGRKGESSIKSDGSRSGSILSVPNVSMAFRYPSKGKQNDEGHHSTPSWDQHVTKTFIEWLDDTGAWQTTRVRNRQGPESSKIAAGHRAKHQVGNTMASAATRDRGGDYAPHDDEVDSSLNRTSETLLNDETHRFEQWKQQTNSSINDEHCRNAHQKTAENTVHISCKVMPQRPHTSSNDVVVFLFQLQRTGGVNACRSKEKGLRHNDAVKEKQVGSSQEAAFPMEEQRPSRVCSQQSNMSGEYPDMTSNAKCSDLNVEAERKLTNSSVQYKGQEKILFRPNDGNSVWDRPQHATKQQRAEARCAPWQQNRNALGSQMQPARKRPSGSKKLQVVSNCSRWMTQKYANPARQDCTTMTQSIGNGLAAQQLLCLSHSSSQ
jgi:hypothetical protein